MVRGASGELQRLVARFVGQQQRDHRQRRHGGQMALQDAAPGLRVTLRLPLSVGGKGSQG